MSRIFVCLSCYRLMQLHNWKVLASAVITYLFSYRKYLFSSTVSHKSIQMVLKHYIICVNSTLIVRGLWQVLLLFNTDIDASCKRAIQTAGEVENMLQVSMRSPLTNIFKISYRTIRTYRYALNVSSLSVECVHDTFKKWLGKKAHG